MNQSELKITPLQKLDRQGVHTLVQWAEAEGWNPGAHDAAVFWATDPDGFYGVYANDELIAGGSIVSYNNEFGFMGLFIVKPEYRAHGIGRQLWHQRRDLLLKRLNPNAAIGMDGVVAMQPFYQKGGFEIAFKDERYEKWGMAFPLNPNITSIETSDLGQIASYDQQCFGVCREEFLNHWLHIPENHNFKYTNQHALKGYAVLRKAKVGYKIGPLFADDKDIAAALYEACLNAAVGQPVYLDIPMNHQEAIELVKKYDAQYVFECARMYHGQPPKVETNKIFGITTFELG